MMILAHYWGIDEIGIFVVPAIIAVVGLRWAERKAKARAKERESNRGDQETTDVK